MRSPSIFKYATRRGLIRALAVFLAVFVSTAASNIVARPMSESEVRAAVETWVRNTTPEARPEAVVESMEPYAAGGEIVAYIARLSGGGFCLCGLDEILLPVYLYSAHGTYDPDNPGYQCVLSQMTERALMVREWERNGDPRLDDLRLRAAERPEMWADLMAGVAPEAGTYDNELLDSHYITGDGRGNENVGLTAVHTIFHSEHNRLVEANKATILQSGDLAFINEWLLVDVATAQELLGLTGRLTRIDLIVPDGALHAQEGPVGALGRASLAPHGDDPARDVHPDGVRVGAGDLEDEAPAVGVLDHVHGREVRLGVAGVAGARGEGPPGRRASSRHLLLLPGSRASERRVSTSSTKSPASSNRR